MWKHLDKKKYGVRIQKYSADNQKNKKNKKTQFQKMVIFIKNNLVKYYFEIYDWSLINIRRH